MALTTSVFLLMWLAESYPTLYLPVGYLGQGLLGSCSAQPLQRLESGFRLRIPEGLDVVPDFREIIDIPKSEPGVS